MHFELLSNDEGVSLERTHLDTSSENWASASYKFKYGTPGYINSQFRSISNNSNFASLVSKTISPDGDGWEDKLLIKINNENNPSVVSLTIYNEFGQLLSKVKSQQLVGVSGLIEWDGLTNGRAAPMGNYIAFVQSIASDGSIIKAKLVFTVLKNNKCVLLIISKIFLKTLKDMG